MLDVFGFPSPQQSNYQEFYGGGTTRDWVKPRGVSMVRFMLIGAGGRGSNGYGASRSGGGGSGAVTQWIGPAIFIPDILRVSIGAGGRTGVAGGNTTIVYQAKDGTGYTLLTANGGANGNNNVGGTGGAASSNNFFGASGIFTSIAGENGTTGVGSTTISIVTCGSGGGAGTATPTAGSDNQGNYGYIAKGGAAGNPPRDGNSGFFVQMPILVSVGGAGGGGVNTVSVTGGRGGDGGIGSGGGGGGGATSVPGTGGNGGDGAVLVWAW